MRPFQSPPRTSPAPSPLWVVAGGKGGVGRSLLVANLGIHLARHGKRVTVVDFDLEGPNLHGYLGLGRLPHPSTHRPGPSPYPPAFHQVDTSVPGLKLVPGFHPVPGGAQRGELVEMFLRHRGSLQSELVLVDCGSGRSPETLDLVLASSMGILVGTPEPIAIESIYLFTEALVARLLSKSLSEKTRIRLEEIQKPVKASLQPMNFRSAIERLGEQCPSSAEEVLSALGTLRLHLILNQVRTEREAVLDRVLQWGFRTFYGLDLSPVNNIEFDLSVLESLQKRKSLSQQYPNCVATLGIEKAASTLLSSWRCSNPAPLPLATPLTSLNYYQTLGIPPNTPSRGIQEAYELARKSFDPGSPYRPPFLREAEGRRVGRRIESAYRNLIFLESRTEYDQKLVEEGILTEDEVHIPEPPEPESMPAPARDAPEKPTSSATATAFDKPEKARRSSPPALAPGQGLPVTGASLREYRLANGLSLEAIVAKTKIRGSILTALEEDRLEDLPEPVFLKAFLRQLAACLGLNPEIICREYMDRSSAPTQAAEGA